MKIKLDKGPFIAILIFAAIIAAVVIAVMVNRNSARSDLARRVAELEPESGNTPSTIEGLRTAIAMYEDELQVYINDSSKTGLYWKILATRLHDKAMFGEALEAANRGIHYNPEDPALHYMRGICAGRMAKSSFGTEKTRFYQQSEAAYKRAIELDPAYSRPYYGLGVLYTFELERPAEAIPYLEIYIYQMRRYDVDAFFVLGRAYFLAGEPEKAIGAYDEIIARTKNDIRKNEALKNKEFILDSIYGN